MNEKQKHERDRRKYGEMSQVEVCLVSDRDIALDRLAVLAVRCHEVADELRKIAAERRADWSDFDGRILRDQLLPLADKLDPTRP